MKRFVLMIIPALICGIMFWVASSCNKEDFSTFNNPDDFRLVKTLRYSSSTATKPVGGLEYTYDKNGNMVNESTYDYQPTRTLWMYYEYEYSGNKKVKEKKFTGVPGNLKLELYIEYFYENNRLVKEETNWSTGYYASKPSSVNYEYDERGNLIRKYSYQPYYEIINGVFNYTYDNQNRLILEEFTDIDAINYHRYIKYIFDDNGREAKIEYYNVNWDLLNYVEKIYNGTNKLPKKELRYDENGNQTSKHQHIYDKWGNHTETILNDEFSLFKRKYNGKLLIEEIYYSFNWGYAESGMLRYEYKRIK